MVITPHQNYISSFSCELRIIKTKNIELKSTGGCLFVRYYLSAGSNSNSKRIQLNSQEISSSSDLIWNESFSLECLGTEDSIKELKQQSVVFELRWRKSAAAFLLRKKSKSQLLGRAEVPWKQVFESPNMEIEKWVMMVPQNNKTSARVCEDHDVNVKPPSLQVAMRIEAPRMVEMEKTKRSERLKKWNECGCADHGDFGACNCSDYDIFALVAALETL